MSGFSGSSDMLTLYQKAVGKFIGRIRSEVVFYVVAASLQ